MADRASPYGYATYVGPVPGGGVDMTRDGRTCSDEVLVRNALVARCMSGTISMIGAPGDVRDFGENVREWAGEAIDASAAAQKAQRLTVIFARDPRVDPGSIRVRITADGAGPLYSFLIYVSARLTNGRPISMVMGVSSVTVDVLARQGAT